MGCRKGDEADVDFVGVSFEGGFVLGRKLGGELGYEIQCFCSGWSTNGS